MTPPGNARLRVLDCEIDVLRRVVARAQHGEERRLTHKAMQVLLVLVERGGQVVTRDTLLQRVWPDTMPTDDVLTQAITQLRKAFGDDRDAPRYIETIAKTGYRLLAPAQWLDDARRDAGKQDHAPPAPPPQATVSEPAAPSATPRARSRWRWLRVALVAAALVAVAAIALRALPQARPQDSVADGAAAAAVLELGYRAITSTPEQERSPALSPDGSTVAFVRADAGGGAALMLQPVSQASARALTAAAPGVSDSLPVWSRDGTRIAFVRVSGADCRFMLIAASGGEPREIGPCLDGDASQFDWTPDGRGLVMGGARPAGGAGAPLQRLALATGRWQPLRYAIGEGDVDQLPRYSPDGRWLAFRRNMSLADLWIMPAEGGAPRPLTRLRRDIRGWDWLPDSSGLVLSQVGSQASLWLLRLADGRLQPLSQLPEGNAVHPDIAADAWSMVLEIDRSRSGLFRARVDGRAETALEPVFASSGVDMLPALSPDGQTLAFLSDRSMAVQLWLGEVGQLATLRAIEGLHPLPRHPPAWSPDGSRLLVLGRTGGGERLFEVEAASGRVELLAVPAARPVFASYTADAGQLLVGVDDGRGRVRAVLYRRADWRVLATKENVSLARFDAASGAVFFTRGSTPGLWRTDLSLRGDVAISGELPDPPYYRHWVLSGGQPYSIRPERGCATPWRPLDAARQAGRCVSPGEIAVGGASALDGEEGWLYLGLPISQNIDIGWAQLPRTQAQASARVDAIPRSMAKVMDEGPQGMTFGCDAAQCRFDFVPVS